MKLHSQEPVSFQDVKVMQAQKYFWGFNNDLCSKFDMISSFKRCFKQDEIFDMVKPKDPYKITLQDLVNSCQGDTVVSILIDLNGFWTYENREMLVTNDDSSSNTADFEDT